MWVGELVASGRDCDVYAAGSGRVVRRNRIGRSLEPEVRVMRHARKHGYPVPGVLDVDGPDMLMERLDGLNMLEDVARRPRRVRSHARLLADLHRQLSAVPAPDWLAEAEGCAGDRLLHLDLHPLNVIMTDDGPAVIDWTNARRGAPGADVATTWLLMASGELTGRLAAALESARQVFLGAFLDHVGREQARPFLRAVIERQQSDPNKSSDELARMDDVVSRNART